MEFLNKLHSMCINTTISHHPVPVLHFLPV